MPKTKIKYKLEDKEYRGFCRDLILKNSKSSLAYKVNYIRNIMIIALAMAALAYFKQILLIISIVFIIVFYKKRYYKWYPPLAKDIIEIETNKEYMIVSIEQNKIKLYVGDIECARKLDACYYISHNIGIVLFVPFRSLSIKQKKYFDNLADKYDDGYRNQHN